MTYSHPIIGGLERQYLCRVVKIPPSPKKNCVQVMVLNLMPRLLFCRSGKCRVILYCYYSQVHSMCKEDLLKNH